MWNFQNGHNLHKLEPVEEAEVTGILQLPDKKVFLTVGWNQKIVTYDDKDADVSISVIIYFSINLPHSNISVMVVLGKQTKDGNLIICLCPELF